MTTYTAAPKLAKLPEKQFKSLLNGVIAQDFDYKIEQKEDLKTVTKIAPSETQIDDLLFANKIAKTKGTTEFISRISASPDIDEAIKDKK